MDQTLSSGDNSLSDRQDILCLLRNPSVHSCFQETITGPYCEPKPADAKQPSSYNTSIPSNPATHLSPGPAILLQYFSVKKWRANNLHTSKELQKVALVEFSLNAPPFEISPCNAQFQWPAINVSLKFPQFRIILSCTFKSSDPRG
jgi:hypothetical protein